MNYYSQVIGIKETDKGTDLIVRIPGEKVKHKIIKVKNGNVINSEIKIDDNRIITSDQRKKIYATIKDISDYLGEWPSYYKEFLKFNFCFKNNIEYFSLSDCSISIAREFITYLIDFILEHDIPLSDKVLNRVDDIDRYLYGCIKHKRCCICGRRAELHHVDVIGIGNNRNTLDDSKYRKMALCREHHTESHKIGQDTFNKKYKVYGITYEDIS
ncbi:putative HNHc nuclease [Senegalia massiliensis]|uniref:putative HNHc nuclease n=1 Tax=Senegalia massiliensis TaxID=1720316 RepID=UPI0010300A69|nr:putative HNHc nuclease [Senegalia massiliensis]